MKIYLRAQAFMLVALLFATAVFAEQPSAKKKQLGIATYSVKGLESDLEGAFKSLQEDGYTVMEIANYNTNEGTVAGMSPAEYAALVEKYGMDIISSHARAGFDASDVEGTLAGWGKVFDDHKDMGCKYVVFPMNQFSEDIDQLKKECELLNLIGEEANKRGLKFGYHNHNMEFETMVGGDQPLEDFLIANTDPDKIFFQMDVYWVTIGKQDPVTYLKKYPDRFKVLHIKDDYVIGESGKIDYEAIFNQFYKNGYNDWFVEIEEYMSPEQRAQMMEMMQQMRERQRQAAERAEEGGQQGGRQARQGGDQPRRMGPPQRSPEEEAKRLSTSLEAIAKSAEYLENASFVK
jgi:sugar phosphate isomerase/epimerase